MLLELRFTFWSNESIFFGDVLSESLFFGRICYIPSTKTNFLKILKKVLEWCLRLKINVQELWVEMLSQNVLFCSYLVCQSLLSLLIYLLLFLFFNVYTMHLLCYLAKGSIQNQCPPAADNMKRRVCH